MKKIIPLLPLLVLIYGCSTIPQTYIAAERATYCAIAPEYLGYVEKDPNLTAFQKEVRFQTVDLWNSRIGEAEAIYE